MSRPPREPHQPGDASLTDRTALVTGGGRGIGRAIAERLSAAGASVIVVGRSEPEVAATARAIGGIGVALDLTDRAATDMAIEELTRQGRYVDILVNNAGIADSAPLERTTDEAWDRALEINATVPFRLCRALVPGMVARGFGRVVNIASNAGRVGYAYTAAYSASKHAVVGLTRALAVELARTPVTVNAVCPGWVDTQIARDAIARIADKTGRTTEAALAELTRMSPQRRLMQPEEVAHLVLALCADEARGIHGQAIPLDGGQVMA